jgi:hypothetical protein
MFNFNFININIHKLLLEVSDSSSEDEDFPELDQLLFYCPSFNGFGTLFIFSGTIYLFFISYS